MASIIQTTLRLTVAFIVLVLVPRSEGKSECREKVADVVFLLDSSFSIWQHEFTTQLQFLSNLVNAFTIGPNHIRVGVVTYSTHVRLDMTLKEHMSRDALQRAIGQIQYMEGGTRTGDAIQYAHTDMFKEENGSRPWAAHIVVLITDGYSHDRNVTFMEASIARSKGIELFAIGVGRGVDEAELREIASDPDDTHMFRVDGYGALKHIESAFTSGACHKPNSTESMQEDESEPHTAKETATKRCGGKPADVYFLLDSSSSIWHPQFKDQLHFVSQLLRFFDLGPERTRVGVAVFSDNVSEVVALSDAQTPHSIRHALTTSPYLTGGTNTGSALSWVRTQGFANARRDVAHVIIVLTDGQSANSTDTVKEARRAHQEGIYLFSVGIGNQTDVKELMDIASDPDENFVFHVDDFGGLKNILELLAIKACDVEGPSFVSDQSASGCQFTKPTDILFVYDSSSVSRLESDAISGAIRNVIRAVDSEKDMLRYGLIRGNCYEGDNMNLKTGATVDELEAVLDKAHHNGLHILLRRLRLHGYLAGYDDTRRHAHKVVVLFVGTKLLNTEAAELESKRLKFQGVRLLIVAFGSAADNDETLRQMASVPLVVVDSDESLPKSKHDILERLCDVSMTFV